MPPKNVPQKSQHADPLGQHNELQTALAFSIAMLIKHSNVCPDVISHDLQASLEAVVGANECGVINLQPGECEAIFKLKIKAMRIYNIIKDV